MKKGAARDQITVTFGTGEISGVLAPASHERLTLTERQTLLSSGIATHYSGKDGVVRIERSITTYQKNPWGSNDTSYLDSENLHQLAYVMRYLRTGVTTQFGRHALRSDVWTPRGTPTGEDAHEDGGVAYLVHVPEHKESALLCCVFLRHTEEGLALDVLACLPPLPKHASILFRGKLQHDLVEIAVA